MSEDWGYKFTCHLYVEGQPTKESQYALIEQLNLALNKFENHKDGQRVNFFGMSMKPIHDEPSDQTAT